MLFREQPPQGEFRFLCVGGFDSIHNKIRAPPGLAVQTAVGIGKDWQSNHRYLTEVYPFSTAELGEAQGRRRL